MSTSWLELCCWHDKYALLRFPWNEWVSALRLPLPIYDLPRILDVSAAFDMAVHALYWRATEPLKLVRITKHMQSMMRCIDVCEPHQQMYMARALYAHCSQYVTGVPRITNPPTYHVDDLPIIPYDNLVQLAQATLTPMPALCISEWLDRTLRYGACSSLTLRSRFRTSRLCGRRGRKHAVAVECKAMIERTQHACDNALATLASLAPDHVPTITCTVSATAATALIIVLSVQQRLPCDV